MTEAPAVPAYMRRHGEFDPDPSTVAPRDRAGIARLTTPFGFEAWLVTRHGECGSRIARAAGLVPLRVRRPDGYDSVYFHSTSTNSRAQSGARCTNAASTLVQCAPRLRSPPGASPKKSVGPMYSNVRCRPGSISRTSSMSRRLPNARLILSGSRTI